MASVTEVQTEINNLINKINQERRTVRANSNSQIMFNGSFMSMSNFYDLCKRRLRAAGVNVPTTITDSGLVAIINNYFDGLKNKKGNYESDIAKYEDEKKKLEDEKKKLESERTDLEQKLVFARRSSSDVEIIRDLNSKLFNVNFSISKIDSQLSNINSGLSVGKTQLADMTKPNSDYSFFDGVTKSISYNKSASANSKDTAKKLVDKKKELQEALMNELTSKIKHLEQVIVNENSLRLELANAGYDVRDAGLLKLSNMGAKYYLDSIRKYYSEVLNTYYSELFNISNAIGQSNISLSEKDQFLASVDDIFAKEKFSSRVINPVMLQSNIYSSMKANDRITRDMAKRKKLVDNKKAFFRQFRLRKINKKLQKRQAKAQTYKIRRTNRALHASFNHLNSLKFKFNMLSVNSDKLRALISSDFKLINDSFVGVVEKEVFPNRRR